jgi:hypothetical protein
MNILLRIFGWPHELLHVLALRLIRRQPTRVQQTHVDIPDDLSTGQFVFVAGLPALVFGLAAAVGLQLLFTAGNIAQVILWLLVTVFFALGVAGCVGDLMLILARVFTPKDY